MNRLFIGPCPVCNQQIWEMQDGKLIQNELGTHFWILSNHNTVAKFAICKDCLEILDMAQIADIVDRQVFTWLEDLLKEPENVSRYQFDKYRFYVATAWFKTEEEAITACRQGSI